MSEDSKMGLFGSKGKSQEHKEKTSKDNSPGHYVPYCIDSDTETFDTETLSIMDINDIIGVQSGEQINDSTLESEIAALSQIITESKVEVTRQLADSKSEAQRGCSNDMCKTQQQGTDYARENEMNQEQSSIVADESVSKDAEVDSVKRDKASNLNTKDIVDDESRVHISESSSNDESRVGTDLPTNTLADTCRDIARDKRQEDITFRMDYEKNFVKRLEKESVSDTTVSEKGILGESKDETKPVMTVGICKSLQLIGEAYISEDSEETNMDDTSSSKETMSLATSKETPSFNISAIRREKNKSERVEALERNVKKSYELNDEVGAAISGEANAKVDIDRRTEDADVKVENSSQSQELQQTIIGSLILDEAIECIDGGISGECKRTKDKTEIETNAIEKISLLERQSFDDDSAEVFVVSSEKMVENTEENQEIEDERVGLELSTSASTIEREKQDNSAVSSGSESPHARVVSDNFPPIEDDAKELVKGTVESKSKDIFSESVNNTPNLTIIEASNEKLSIVDTVTSKNYDLQETSNIVSNTQMRQMKRETISVEDKINDDSQRITVTLVNLETTSILTSENQNNMDSAINTKEMQEDMSEAVTEMTSVEPSLKEDRISSSPSIEKREHDVTNTVLSANNIDTTDVNNPEETAVCMEETMETTASLILLERDKSVRQPSSEEFKANEINISPDKLENLHCAPTPIEITSGAIVNIRESLFEAERMEDLIETPKITSSFANEEKTSCIKDIPLDRSKSCVHTELVSHIEADDVASPLCGAIHEEDTTEMNVAAEILSSETENGRNETLASKSNEENIVEDENHAEEKDKFHNINLVLEPKALGFDARAASSRNKDVQDAGETCDENAKVFEKDSIEIDIIPLMKEKTLKPSIEKSTDATSRDARSNDASALTSREESSERATEERNKGIDLKDLDIDLKVLENDKCDLDSPNNTMEIFPKVSSLKDAADTIRDALSDDNEVDDKSILETEKDAEEDDANVLQNSMDLPLEANIEQLAEKLSRDDTVHMDDTISTQNLDSLDGLLDLDLMSSNESSSRNAKAKDKASAASKNVDVDFLLERVDQSEATSVQNSDYIANVITNLTNRDDETGGSVIEASADDKSAENEGGKSLKINEDASAFKADDNLQMNTDLNVTFEDSRSKSVNDLNEIEAKLELSRDVPLKDVVPSENLTLDTPNAIENSQSSSEISELESAVKFLQESEEQTIDSPLVLSPKMMESVVEDITKQANAELYTVPDEADGYSNAESELASRISISISEAEIISEAAKLENERKFAARMQNVPDTDAEEKNAQKKIKDEVKSNEKTEHRVPSEISSGNAACNMEKFSSAHATERLHEQREGSPDIGPLSNESVLKACELIPRASILEERLKEPPKIEIPVPDSTKALESTISPNDSLLIPKDARAMTYSRMLESPKSSDRSTIEPKAVDTPRKDSEKHDFENVGSPRIILKIAKSAIADCGEPRSPKSPKIRSAANSPNPEDSPGQKLGKIKLKLSKGGHPSIISNENLDETGQWHTDSHSTSSSLSPIGMKIKLSKSGDASIVTATTTSTEKHESNADDSKEMAKYKFEELRRTDSPIGMKIKLSKSGDSASIVQQDTKEPLAKHKEKLEMPQGSPKRTESPIGVKIKLSKSGDASIIQTADKQECCLEERKESVPKRTESPIGVKIKLSKTGDASIVSPSDQITEDAKDSSSRTRDKQDLSVELPKRNESPIGMKIKLSKCKGGAAIISVDNSEDAREKVEVPDPPKRTESPLGMKIKLSKSGDASIIHSDTVTDDAKEARHKEKSEQDVTKPMESIGIKLKVVKSTGETTSTILPATTEERQDASRGTESSSIGVKIKVSKSGDATIMTDKTDQGEDSRSRENSQAEASKRTESPIGMKLKLSKSGDVSIVQNETSVTAAATFEDQSDPSSSSSSLGMRIKLIKASDHASVIETDSGSRKDKQQRRKETADSPLEMKIKLSKTGHPTIVACDSHGAEGSSTHKGGKDPVTSTAVADSAFASFSHRYTEHHTAHMVHSKESTSLKILKTGGVGGSGSGGHPSILQGNQSELTIEPVTPIQIQSRKVIENTLEISAKRKDITISPVENKKSKLETQLSQILPEVTIQPVMCRDQKQQQQQQQQLLFDPKTSLISRQQMNVISQEISITQVRPTKMSDASMSGKLKDILCKTGSPGGSSDCEIIEHRPELIIVNENSNSSQDVVIIEEVPPPNRSIVDIKVPKKRGRPRRNPLAQQIVQPSAQTLMPRDPLALDELQQVPQLEHRENERPKRTCRNQKSYAPPKRGRGRGRGKRKMDSLDVSVAKKPRIDQDLNAIEASTMAVITIDETPIQQDSLRKSSELYKALKGPPVDLRSAGCKMEKHSTLTSRKETGIKDSKTSDSASAMQLDCTRISCMMQEDSSIPSTSQTSIDSALLDAKDSEQHKKPAVEVICEKTQKAATKQHAESKGRMSSEIPVPPGHSNWLTPTSKKQMDAAIRSGETVSTVQVIDEETRMSAESGSRSQTPARNIPVQASETIINEESQGSVLSTATTESEKVKVKNRRMEINFDPDEGPFTVDKIAEYEWPLDRKGETFMIQEQISQYLGVKSFKRKYPDLKRRMVDMEERNYLRENGLVSEAMCDMGLTAVCSSEVLDVMCSDFPDQYEEYRKHMREKQAKEHSKKQKELTAAANAERNRIDLAEMAMQSAMSWNVNLNKARRENRKCCLDLQTFTIHVPKKQQKMDTTEHRVNHYPVALIPGQYTDYYREYTSAELRYYPLNTVLYGPMRPNERKFDSQSEGSQSDSDSESSSDDSSSSSSEGTQDTGESQSTMDDVDMEIVTQKDDVKLKCKMCLKVLNKHNKNEILIQCGTCNGNVHPSCIDLTLDMVPHIQSYAWQCTDCKTCAQCHDPADEDKMLFCDMCDRGYHIYCVGLRRVPQGRWHCQECAVCANCGSKEPGGPNSDRNSVAQWQHEYKKGEKNIRVYVSTLCIPCSKLWRKGRYCPHCSRCHTAQRLDLEVNLVHCSACDKYLHLDCVETKGVAVDKKNYLCDLCTPLNRQQVIKPLMSKTLKT